MVTIWLDVYCCCVALSFYFLYMFQSLGKACMAWSLGTAGE